MTWQRPLQFQEVVNLVSHIATSEPRKPLVFELRSDSGKVSYFLGLEKSEAPGMLQLFKSHGNIEFGQELRAGTTLRKPVKVSRKLHMTKPILSLKTDNAENLARTTLAGMAQVNSGDQIAIQIVIGVNTLQPENLPKNLPSPEASWWNIIAGNVPNASSGIRTSIKDKVSSHRLPCVFRIGAYSKDEAKAKSYILNVLSSLRGLEARGIRISLQTEQPLYLNQAKTLFRYPLRLNVKELANLFLLPIGELDFFGATPLHPKILLPPKNLKNPTKNIRAFGETLNENPKDKRLLHLDLHNALKNLFVVGPTGSGKSVVLENLVLADIENGHGVVVIDPKYSLVASIAEKIPEHRLKDVVILDLTSNHPLGINPLSFIDGKSPELVAETVLSSLRGLFPDFGIYTEELLTTGLLTLARNKNTTLLHLPLLFTNEKFRHKMTANLTDMYLKSYWQAFEAQPDKDRNQQLAPLIRRLNVLLMRPAFRDCLGQAEPKFNLEDVFTKNKILLVPLNSGVVGQIVAEMVGSLIINLLFDVAMKRAELSEEQRQPISLVVDEFHAYIKKSAGKFEQILALTRGLGMACTLACQNLGQMPKELKEAVFTNARSKIIFGTPNKRDAVQFADLTASQLSEIDFQSLPQFQVYTTLNEKKIANVWLSGKTFPPKPSLRLPAEVFAKSAETYGRNIDEIEKEYIELMSSTDKNEPENLPDEIDFSVGRLTKKTKKSDE